MYAQLTYERLLKAESEPQNWLTYSGSYKGWRYSKLDQIHAGNVKNLGMKWVYQMKTLEKVETTPLVVDGVMYFTEPPSNVIALDPFTGRQFWRYKRSLPGKVNVCCDQVNRGVAMLGDRIFVGTVDAHLVALQAKTGAVIWDTEVADYRTGHSITSAPLIVKDMVITGVSGGEYGSAASSTPTIQDGQSAAGGSGPFPVRARRETKPGPATPGSAAAAPPGSRAHSTPNKT
jgi:alcohol dehydrogenase (cytochrome c)